MCCPVTGSIAFTAHTKTNREHAHNKPTNYQPFQHAGARLLAAIYPSSCTGSSANTWRDRETKTQRDSVVSALHRITPHLRRQPCLRLTPPHPFNSHALLAPPPNSTLTLFYHQLIAHSPPDVLTASTGLIFAGLTEAGRDFETRRDTERPALNPKT